MTVTDQDGKSSSDAVTIKVGNTAPQVSIQTGQNRTFFSPKSTPFAYTVQVSDKEDKPIDKKNVKFVLNYIPKVKPETQMGHQQ